MTTSIAAPRLLVSVRSVDEAKQALAGGADLIDVKEPSRGPLGAADFGSIADIVRMICGQVPVSAAMGEWADWKYGPTPTNLTYAKWGLAGVLHANPAAGRIRETVGVNPVLVAYADFERAKSPPLGDLVQAACDLRFPAFLIDTALKDGTTLLDWVSISSLSKLRDHLSRANVPLALAGSLDLETVRKLLPLAPDWIAIRGAACDGGRDGMVSAQRVRRLRAEITRQWSAG